MNLGNIRSTSFNKKRFKRNDNRRTFCSLFIAVIQHLLNGGGKTPSFFFRQQLFIRIDDITGLVDLPQPVKIIPRRPGFCGFSRFREIGASHNSKQGKQQQRFF